MRLTVFLWLASSLSTGASAQQFQAPTLPAPPIAATTQKAYEAKQAYLTEQSFSEHNAYPQSETPQSTNFQSSNRGSAESQHPAESFSVVENIASAKEPKIFMPPVHIAPVANSQVVSPSNEPTSQVESTNRVAVPGLQRPGYNVLAEPNASLSRRSPNEKTLHSVVEPPAKTENAGRALVDRRNSTVNAPSNRIARAERRPRQPVSTPRLDRRRQSPKTNSLQNNIEVRHAFGAQQRIVESSQFRQNQSVQHATMFEPTHDPFNDQSTRLRQVPRRVELTAPRSNYVHGDSGQPMRQISILSNGNGSSNQLRQEQATVQEFNVPSKDRPTQPRKRLFSNVSQQNVNEIDQELNRRIEELEPPSRRRERSRAEQMVEDLDRQMQQNGDDDPSRRDSILEDSDRSIEAGGSSTQIAQPNCDEFRDELLSGSIRDISLDISPPASLNRDRYVPVSRSWIDRSGNVIATGTMVDLRRGYVILDGAEGQIKIPYSKLSEADWAAVSDYWQLPELCSVGFRGEASRCWIPQTHTWKASSLCHKPLFFEDIQLERYGHSHGPFTQPIHSVGHFFLNLVTVPYHCAINPANECQYALGFYRPGNCAPWLKDPIPISLRAAGKQALVMTALAYIP